MEPGEICENRPNLRRRMGTYCAKPEPGKNKASKEKENVLITMSDITRESQSFH